MLCALKKVIQNLLTEHKSATQIILVTQENGNTISKLDNNLIKEEILRNNIGLSTIVIAEKNSKSDSYFFDELTSVMGGKSYKIDTKGSLMDFYVSINEAYDDILKADAKFPTEIPEVVHKESYSGNC